MLDGPDNLVSVRKVTMKRRDDRAGSLVPAEVNAPLALTEVDLNRSADMVARAADSFAEMSRRQREVESAATKAVLHYRAESEALSKRCQDAEARAAAAEAALDAKTEQYQIRFDELQTRLKRALTDLENKTESLRLANDWLVYINNQIQSSFGELPKVRPWADVPGGFEGP